MLYLNPLLSFRRIRSLLPLLAWGVVLTGLLILVVPGPAAFTPRLPTPAVTPAARIVATPTATPAYFEPLAGETPVARLGTPVTPSPSPVPTRPRPTSTPPLMLHKIQPGDTLIAIASEYSITTEALLVANDIRDPNSLEEGQELVIPPPEGPQVPLVMHTVKPGDTLLSIAARYGSSVKDILAINPGLSTGSLQEGQIIAVPVVFIPARPDETVDEPVYYTVEPGDMPLSIAYEFEVPVELLLAANNITDPTSLQIGQQLIIPPANGLTLGVPIILYELEEGDTLLDVAIKFASSLKDILAVNPDLELAALEVGQTVAVPIIFELPRPTPAPDNRPAAPVAASLPLVDLQGQMVALVNAEREAEGLPPYEEDAEITRMAQAHARDMVVRSYLAHVTPDGKTLRDRFAEASIGGVYRVGEDIQRNTRPFGETVQAALTWFMGSPPHRNNILHPKHNRIGVGIVEGPAGWYTFVLVFAER